MTTNRYRVLKYIDTHSALVGIPLPVGRTVALVGTISNWQELYASANFTNREALGEYIYQSALSTPIFTVRIYFTELEARYVLSQAAHWCLNIKRESA
jgi:hypothetical protein